MDRIRPTYTSEQSSTGSPGGTSSPMMSPLNRHARSSSAGMANMRKGQNTAAKAAAQRLAHMMASQGDDDTEDEDDLLYDYNSGGGIGGIGLAGRGARPCSPLSIRTTQDQAPSSRSMLGTRTSFPVNPLEQRSSTQSISVGRPSQGTNSVEQAKSARPAIGIRLSMSSDSVGQASSTTTPSWSAQPNNNVEEPRSPGPGWTSQAGNTVDQVPSARSMLLSRSSKSNNYAEQVLNARSTTPTRSAQSNNSVEQPISARPTTPSRPNQLVKSVPIVPATVPIAIKPITSAIPSESPMHSRKDKRMSLDLGSMNARQTAINHSTSDLQDELDMLQEENESLLEKLRMAEDRCEEAEVRARQLEQQVASLGQGVSLEARLLSRKEAALQQREAALRVAEQTYGGTGRGDDVAFLRAEAEIARNEASSALEQLHEAEEEIKLSRTMAQRIMLTQEEMEELALKRCWLSRYWSLCVQYGIHAEIAPARHEYWSLMAPLPSEDVLSAGRRAKDENASSKGADERRNVLEDFGKLSGEKNIESMLIAEKGMRELVSLKVEEAVAFAMALERRANSQKSGFTDELKIPIDGQSEAFGLSQEECDDVLFKQAWLTYYWRRAKNHGIEPDIADERLQFWINQTNFSITSHDAVNVERGLIELKKLGLETQLWGESRKGLEEGTTNLMTQTHF